MIISWMGGGEVGYRWVEKGCVYADFEMGGGGMRWWVRNEHACGGHNDRCPIPASRTKRKKKRKAGRKIEKERESEKRKSICEAPAVGELQL